MFFTFTSGKVRKAICVSCERKEKNHVLVDSTTEKEYRKKGS